MSLDIKYLNLEITSTNFLNLSFKRFFVGLVDTNNIQLALEVGVMIFGLIIALLEMSGFDSRRYIGIREITREYVVYYGKIRHSGKGGRSGGWVL